MPPWKRKPRLQSQDWRYLLGGGARTASTTSRVVPRLRTECTTPEGANAAPPLETNCFSSPIAISASPSSTTYSLSCPACACATCSWPGSKQFRPAKRVAPRAISTLPIFWGENSASSDRLLRNIIGNHSRDSAPIDSLYSEETNQEV